METIRAFVSLPGRNSPTFNKRVIQNKH